MDEDFPLPSVERFEELLAAELELKRLRERVTSMFWSDVEKERAALSARLNALPTFDGVDALIHPENVDAQIRRVMRSIPGEEDAPPSALVRMGASMREVHGVPNAKR